MTAQNLDAMNDDELKEITTKHKHQRIRLYAHYILRARQHRLDGHIQAALACEKIADKQYDALPENLKW